MSGMTIGELARKSGLRASAIRYYEKLGLLPVAARDGSRRRRYAARALERLAIIRFAKYVGFGIAEIRRLLDGFEGRPPPQRWRQMALRQLEQVDLMIAQANTVRGMLNNSLDHKCPHLVERGEALLPRSK